MSGRRCSRLNLPLGDGHVTRGRCPDDQLCSCERKPAALREGLLGEIAALLDGVSDPGGELRESVLRHAERSAAAIGLSYAELERLVAERISP